MHIDALGHPIEAGCIVVTGGHYSPVMDHVTTVKRVTPKAVIIDIPKNIYDPHTQKYVTMNKEVRRQAYQVIVVNKQLTHNKKEFPENFV